MARSRLVEKPLQPDHLRQWRLVVLEYGLLVSGLGLRLLRLLSLRWPDLRLQWSSAESGNRGCAGAIAARRLLLWTDRRSSRSDDSAGNRGLSSRSRASDHFGS